MVLREEAFGGPGAQELLAAFTAEIVRLYPTWSPDIGPSANHQDFEPPGGRFVVAYADDRPVACGGLKRLDGRSAEIKRLFVAPDMRGQGVGRRVLERLEELARAAGYAIVRLDTGDRQPGAVALFAAAGYRQIAEYNANPFASHWFEKSLALTSARAQQLAHANVSRLRAPLDSPEMAGFVRALGDVNWLAEQSPGFVWRHRPVDRPVTDGHLGGAGPVIVTVSVWTDYESLQRYVYRSAHALFMQRRARWFEPIPGFTTALWWLPEGDQPTVGEALSRLDHLRTHGPTPRAFSLRHQFGPDGAPSGGTG